MQRVPFAAIVTLTLVGCSQEPYSNLETPRQFFSKHQIGSSSDYAIIKFGNPEDHVVTIHGFSDDSASCREIADALNTNACKETDGKQCLNPYSCDALN